ncbi:hypothetical protein FHT77_006255 [Rhizobium sp. BK181]|nr:hypothetical protein [Rhizobium sp. BK181]
MASLENETQNWVRSYELRLVELAVMTPIDTTAELRSIALETIPLPENPRTGCWG